MKHELNPTPMTWDLEKTVPHHPQQWLSDRQIDALVIEELAHNEARLTRRVADLESERDTYRAIASVALTRIRLIETAIDAVGWNDAPTESPIRRIKTLLDHERGRRLALAADIAVEHAPIPKAKAA